MPSYAELRLLGYVGREPELRYTPNGVPVLHFSLATTRRWQEAGEWCDETTWWNVVVWSVIGERLYDTLTKGDLIEVVGDRVKVETYKDRTTGEPRGSIELTASRVYAMKKKSDARDTENS